MKIYVSAAAARSGCGTEAHPFKTINEAASAAMPGDEVIVVPGIYREYVDPKHAGTPDARIVYRSAEPGKAIITGAERVQNWQRYDGDTWTVRIGNGLFGSYNPYTTQIGGDWYYATEPIHTGEVYLNGKAMYEALSLDEVLKPEIFPLSWEKELSRYKWYTEQDGSDTVIYANFLGADPNTELTRRRSARRTNTTSSAEPALTMAIRRRRSISVYSALQPWLRGTIKTSTTITCP